jgi:hypothetical protein
VLAGAWACALVPAWLWWQKSILFVIIASVYANAVGELSAAEAADDRAVLDEIKALRDEVRKLSA